MTNYFDKSVYKPQKNKQNNTKIGIEQLNNTK